MKNLSKPWDASRAGGSCVLEHPPEPWPHTLGRQNHSPRGVDPNLIEVSESFLFGSEVFGWDPKKTSNAWDRQGGKLIFIVLVYFILRDIYSWDTIRSDTTSPYFFTSNNICCSFLVRSAVEEHCWLLGIYPFHRTYLSSTSRLNNADSNLNQPWGKEASK